MTVYYTAYKANFSYLDQGWEKRIISENILSVENLENRSTDKNNSITTQKLLRLSQKRNSVVFLSTK